MCMTRVLSPVARVHRYAAAIGGDRPNLRGHLFHLTPSVRCSLGPEKLTLLSGNPGCVLGEKDHWHVIVDIRQSRA